MRFAYAIFVAAVVFTRRVAGSFPDEVVQASLCVGDGCDNTFVPGFDTIRMRGENPAITFIDTSNSASFPTQDWQVKFNDDTNPFLSITNMDSNRERFRIKVASTGNPEPVVINANYQLEIGRSEAGATVTPLTASASDDLYERLAELPVKNFDYGGGENHVGPLAEDFYNVFPEYLNDADTHIDPLDMLGIALNALKVMQAKVDSRVGASCAACPVSCSCPP